MMLRKNYLALIRRQFFSLCYRRYFKNAKQLPKINGICRFTKNLSIGGNVNFNGVRILGHGKVTIGDNFHSGENLIILTQNHNYTGTAIPYDSGVIPKDVTIKDNVWIGLNVIILPGISIGEGAIIQAGSVVSQSIPDLAIAGGNPAAVFKYRDQEHYLGCKSNGHYF